MDTPDLGDYVLRPADAARKLGVSRSTLYELIDKGMLEEPIAYGVRSVGWRLSTLDAYLARREAEHKANRERREAARVAGRAARAVALTRTA